MEETVEWPPLVGLITLLVLHRSLPIRKIVFQLRGNAMVKEIALMVVMKWAVLLVTGIYILNATMDTA